MHFKIEKTSPLGITLTKMWDKIFAAREAIFIVARELSDMDDPAFLGSPHHVGGIMTAVQFKQHPGKKWAEEKRHDSVNRYFRPSALEVRKKTELWEKFSSANDPVDNHFFCALFGLRPGSYGGLRWFNRPGFSEANEHYLLNVVDEWAKTIQNKPEEMIEILASEYHRLLEEKKDLE